MLQYFKQVVCSALFILFFPQKSDLVLNFALTNILYLLSVL